MEVVGSGLVVLRCRGRGWGGAVGQPRMLEKRRPKKEALLDVEKLHGARAEVGRADGQPTRRTRGGNALDGCRGDRP